MAADHGNQSLGRTSLQVMRIRERTAGGLLWAVLVFVLLAGVLAMHGLAPHDSAMRWMGSTAHSPAAVTSTTDRLATMSMTSAPAVMVKTQATQTDQRTMLGNNTSNHDVMDLCLAVLTSLLLLALSLLALACALRASRGPFLVCRAVSLGAGAGRPPPAYLRPSLTGLCIARV